MLEREEYVEQNYFFRILGERLADNQPMQESLSAVRDEILSTTKLPLAIDFLLAELKHAGVFSTAMARLGHYFTAFQTYIISEAENERGRFDLRVAVEILRFEAEYRAAETTTQGIFFYQLETLSRNRLKYDAGLKAIGADPAFNDDWRAWIDWLRRQIGVVDLSDIIYTRSEHYLRVQKQQGKPIEEDLPPILFGEKEGKIALANRRKDPLYLFAALQRHLGYPRVPRARPFDTSTDLVPQLARRVERLEARIKLFEEEQKSGIDITKFYQKPEGPRD